MRLAPACRKRLSDLQPDQGIAAGQSLRFENLYRFCLKNLLEVPQPRPNRLQIARGQMFAEVTDIQVFARRLGD